MSRDINDLTQYMADKAGKFHINCMREGIDVLIYSTLRTVVDQSVLYRQGRSLDSIKKKADELSTKYGRDDLAQTLMGVGPQYETRIVTWAGPGQSLHNYGEAFDFVPMLGGKAVWDDESRLWLSCGEVGELLGLTWGGRWSKGKRDMPHFQREGIQWRDLIRTKRFA